MSEIKADMAQLGIITKAKTTLGSESDSECVGTDCNSDCIACIG